MTTNGHLHVVLKNGRWGIKREGTARVFSSYDVKADAIDAAHEIARKEGLDVIVHGKTGQPFLGPKEGRNSSLNEKVIRQVMRGGLLDDFRSAKKASTSRPKKGSTSKSRAASSSGLKSRPATGARDCTKAKRVRP